ncbi:MAG: hypothetical protein JOZ65_06755 [Chloroflexi bacterium]|nr:hypothetical protein [Chloroflexota bacterium]
MSCSGTNACTAVGEGGTILTTTDMGSSRTRQTSPTLQTLRSVSCPSQTTCYAAGGNAAWYFLGPPSSSATPQALVIGTADGGRTWLILNAGDNASFFESISCANQSVCVAVGETNVSPNIEALVAVTANGGTSWTNHVNQSIPAMHSVSCPTATDCYAVGEHGAIERSSDGGATWAGRP